MNGVNQTDGPVFIVIGVFDGEAKLRMLSANEEVTAEEYERAVCGNEGIFAVWRMGEKIK